MNNRIESDFLNGNQIEFLSQNDLIHNSIDEEDDEETREFLLLEQSLLQQENDEEPLFNILKKQVEQIAINDEINLEKSNDEQQNTDEPIILRTKKKISFDANSFNETKETKASHNQELKENRPLTIYIPNTKQDLNLLNHLATLGHDVDSFRDHIQLTPNSGQGYLFKECSNSENNWRKRYFYFDRQSKLFMYFKSFKHFAKQKRPKDVVCFEDIKNVYPDHIRNVVKIPKYYANFSRNFKSRSIFIVKTNRKDFVLSTFSPELMRLWIDLILTGAEAYENYF